MELHVYNLKRINCLVTGNFGFSNGSHGYIAFNRFGQIIKLVMDYDDEASKAIRKITKNFQKLYDVIIKTPIKGYVTVVY